MSTIGPYSTAREMTAAVAGKEISAGELLDLHLARLDEVNAKVNAVVSADPERARKQARAADDATAQRRPVGPLHGLPFAFKDTHEVAGWTTTYGSPLMADHVPRRDELVVARIRAAGVVIMGRTNVPEWAAGSHTFNSLFGTTANPYDLGRSAGGSSGGAAAALACGVVPLADGSDMGGSLRNPASFCNVVGLRPSLGRVPTWPVVNAWETTSVAGPMARNVDDLALLLSVMAGPTPQLPQSLGTPGSEFAAVRRADLAGLRVAVSVDLGGTIEVEGAVREVVQSQATLLSDAGAVVRDAHPDLTGADGVFRTLRAWTFWHRFGVMLEADPAGFKPSLADNIRAGAALTGLDVARAYAQRTSLGERVRRFFDDHDVLLLPVSQVAPFNADEEYPATINGRVQETYLDWMRSAYFITVTGCPAISMPAGFTGEGLPVGVQLVSAANQERRLLGIAAAFEQLNPAGERRPPL
jgi:amidase